LGLPYNMSAKAGASDFKFGKQLGFFKAHHKSTRRRKGGHGPGLGELPKIWGSPFNIYTWLKLATSNLVHGFAKADHKTTRRGKVGWPWARGAPKILGFPYNISATAGASDFKFGIQLGFA